MPTGAGSHESHPSGIRRNGAARATADVHQTEDKGEGKGEQTVLILRVQQTEVLHSAVYHKAGDSRADIQQICGAGIENRIWAMIVIVEKI